MADYSQITSFAPKDALTTGDPNKKIRGSQLDPEFSAIATAIATKYDSADIANNATAAALVSDTTLITPAKLAYALQNATLVLGANVTLAVANAGIPQNATNPSYTAVLSDANKHLYGAGGSGTYTIPANSSVAYPVGTTITFVNDTASTSFTIAITTDTLTMSGTGFTGSRTLAPKSMAMALKVTTTSWMISGSGLT